MEIREGCKLVENNANIMKMASLDPTKDPVYEPKITFIAVQKRHKTRFFPNNPNDGVGNVS